MNEDNEFSFLANLYFIRDDRLPILKKLPTRQLLRLLRDAHISYDAKIGAVNTDFTYAEIKEVLKHREHIPNKIEAKRIRQRRAKLNKTF
jgi:predicted transcriptional regulator